eukprot:3920055-Amphidinium_carterae.1
MPHSHILEATLPQPLTSQRPRGAWGRKSIGRSKAPSSFKMSLKNCGNMGGTNSTLAATFGSARLLAFRVTVTGGALVEDVLGGRL